MQNQTSSSEPTNLCPSDDELRVLLVGESADQQPLTDHLDACATCRAALERLAGICSPAHPPGGSAPRDDKPRAPRADQPRETALHLLINQLKSPSLTTQ